MRSITIEFPSLGTKLNATLLEKDEPELCDMFWTDLSTPQKMFVHHPLSTGGLFIGKGRPPKHPVKVGTQRAPIGRKKWLITRLEPGMIAYAGGNTMRIVYGYPTEALPAHGSPVAD